MFDNKSKRLCDRCRAGNERLFKVHIPDQDFGKIVEWEFCSDCCTAIDDAIFESINKVAKEIK
jgi:hypothetical protein